MRRRRPGEPGGVGADRGRDRQPACGGADRDQPSGHARHGRHLDRRFHRHRLSRAVHHGFEIEWGVPIQIPIIDIRTIGAGGGSIAWIDKGGMLRVGPQSAGANPGPACYGNGGIDRP